LHTWVLSKDLGAIITNGCELQLSEILTHGAVTTRFSDGN